MAKRTATRRWRPTIGAGALLGALTAATASAATGQLPPPAWTWAVTIGMATLPLWLDPRLPSTAGIEPPAGGDAG